MHVGSLKNGSFFKNIIQLKASKPFIDSNSTSLKKFKDLNLKNSSKSYSFTREFLNEFVSFVDPGYMNEFRSKSF